MRNCPALPSVIVPLSAAAETDPSGLGGQGRVPALNIAAVTAPVTTVTIWTGGRPGDDGVAVGEPAAWVSRSGDTDGATERRGG